MSERQALRRQFRARRHALSQHAQRQHALAVAHTLGTHEELRQAHKIGLYVANDGEVDLAPLAVELSRANKQLALPVVGEQKVMDFYRYQPGDELAPNRFHIPEPAPGADLVEGSTLDLVLVPMVAFDDAGNRLGMGVGYYDRYLARLGREARPRTIGIAHQVQHSEIPLPTESWDMPLDCVVTEAGWQVRD